MSYMWNEFNIKTIPAETIVYRDGVFCEELSTLKNEPIIKKTDLPIHVIYVGEICGDNVLNLDASADEQIVKISVNVKIKKPAFLNIFIKNAGKNSEISGTILLDNNSELKYVCNAHHLQKNTAILLKTKVLAGKNSKSELSATAYVQKNCPDCVSNIELIAMAEQNAKINFVPAQEIKSEPTRADHSAAIYTPTKEQVFFLRGAGLSGAEVDTALKEAFLSFD